MTFQVLVPLLAILLCSAGCRGAAPEATTLVEQAFRDCMNLDADAVWAVTAERFRGETSLGQLDSNCRRLAERLGPFDGVNDVTGMTRSIDQAGNRLELQLDTTFAVGSVSASTVLLKEDGAWLLAGFNIHTDDAPRLVPDESVLVTLAERQTERLLANDLAAFHGAFSTELQAQMDLVALSAGYERLVDRFGPPGPSDVPELSPADDEDEGAVNAPLQFESGTGALMLTYHWRGAAWTLVSFDIQPPSGGAPPSQSAGTRPGVEPKPRTGP